MAYSRHLKFDAKPNIAFLRGIFRDLFRSQGYTNNNANSDWDWNRIDGANAPEQPLGPAGREGENNGNGNGTEEVDDNSDDDDDDDSYSEEEDEDEAGAGAGAAEVKHDMDSSLADQHWILDPR